MLLINCVGKKCGQQIEFGFWHYSLQTKAQVHDKDVFLFNSWVHLSSFLNCAGQGILNTCWGMQHIWGAFQLILFPYPTENLNLIIFIHPIPSNIFALCPSAICACRAKSVYIHLSPASVSIPLPLIQSVQGSGIVYIPLSICFNLDGNIPSIYHFHYFLPLTSASKTKRGPAVVIPGL